MRYRTYTRKASAVNAIAKQGLQNVPHTIEHQRGRFVPVFRCDLIDDVRDIQMRGFKVELHETRNVSADNLGDVHVAKGTSYELGSCNFCTRDTKVVYQIMGQGLAVRVCHTCFNTIRKEINQHG